MKQGLYFVIHQLRCLGSNSGYNVNISSSLKWWRCHHHHFNVIALTEIGLLFRGHVTAMGRRWVIEFSVGYSYSQYGAFWLCTLSASTHMQGRRHGVNYSQIMSPRPPLPRKVGGHDPPAPMGAPPLSTQRSDQPPRLLSLTEVHGSSISWVNTI